MYKKIVIPSSSLLVFISFILLASCAYTPPPLRPFPTPETAPIGIEVGMRCPNLIFQDKQGQRKELRDYRGKIVFLSFMASWCPYCQREMPSKQKLYDDLKNDKGIVFVLLTTRNDFDDSKRWAKSIGYSLPIYMSIRLGDGLNVGRIPRTLILDRNGIVVMSKTGEEYWGYWLEPIQDLIRS